MTWFLLSSSLLMAVALLVPASAVGLKRRALEAAALAVLLLPWLSQMMPQNTSIAASQPSVETARAPTIWISFWILGIAVGLFQSLRQWCQVRRLRMQSRELLDEERERVAELVMIQSSRDLRRFRVSSLIETPLALPGRESGVLLPQDWMSWPRRLQGTALRHEWHHVLRHDALLACLMRGFAVLFWFHPLAWRLVSAWSAACEHEADRAAVANADPVAYADDLLAFASGRVTAPVPLPAFTSSRLGDRIALLFVRPGWRRRSRWLALACLLALASITLGCAWLGRPHAALMHDEMQTRLSASAFPLDEAP